MIVYSGLAVSLTPESTGTPHSHNRTRDENDHSDHSDHEALPGHLGDAGLVSPVDTGIDDNVDYRDST